MSESRCFSEGRRLVIVALVSLLATNLHAEHGGTAAFDRLTAEQYQRSQTKVRNHVAPFAWSSDSRSFFYEQELPDGKVQRWKQSLADGAAAGTPVLTDEPMPPAPKRLSEPAFVENGHRGDVSPDGKWEIEYRDGDVWLKERAAGQSRLLARHDEGGRFVGTALWTQDSRRFAIEKRKEVPQRRVHYVRSSPKDQLQPQTFHEDYPKPGDELSTTQPWIFSTQGEEPLAADPSLFPQAFEVDHLSWRKDQQRLSFQYIERGFGHFRVIEMDAKRREQRIVVDESSPTFVYVYGYCFRYDLDDGRELLWLSERDGWNHLYCLDGRDGAVKRQLTKGKWVVKKVIAVDESRHSVVMEVCGIDPQQDPYFVHYVRVDWKTGQMTRLTQSNGTHERLWFSPDGQTYVCRWSRIDQPNVSELRRSADGSLILRFSEGDPSKLKATGWQLPQAFVAKDRYDKDLIYGVVVLPPNFDPRQRYPVIEAIYAGPQDAFVPKKWTPWIMPMHELACHGFIVVKMDGRGTAHRGKDFHNECYKNLKDAGFPDRIKWIKAAAQQYPQMDLQRVGIFGGSAGGQNALGALLFHGDFYRAAVADCGCHDNRMDKIWWNEQWMDWPVGPEYADQSNVTHASKLQGALMLTVGETDTNVDPSSTMQVVNALILADKDFDLIVVPNGQHGCGEMRHMQRKRVDFFLRHLGGPQAADKERP